MFLGDDDAPAERSDEEDDDDEDEAVRYVGWAGGYKYTEMAYSGCVVSMCSSYMHGSSKRCYLGPFGKRYEGLRVLLYRRGRARMDLVCQVVKPCAIELRVSPRTGTVEYIEEA